MTSHPKTELEIPLEDEDGDVLIEKAAALMHRHERLIAADDDDLPVLTDVVEERIEPFIGERAPIVLTPADDEPALGEPEIVDDSPVIAPAAAAVDFQAQLVALDAAIARHIEHWVANELPQLVSRELDELAARIGDKAAAHLRATLLPAVSAEIADTLDNQSGD